MSLFYAGYFFLLKNDTSFKANRIFLLAGIVTSLLLPSLEITRTIEVESSAASFFPENLSAEVLASTATRSESFDWWQMAGIIYLVGLSFFLFKFLVEVFSLLKLIYSHKTIPQGDHYLIQKYGNTQPFSFFKYIVIDPDQHTSAELEMILKHERSHVRQWHSVDQIISSLSVFLLWFNPFSWLYRKSLVQNLEYLADKEVLATEVSKMEYQKTLLKISVARFKPALTNQFYQSFIKKRIMMLNKNVSQKSNFWKVSFLLPFLFFFIFSFNVKTEAMAVPVQDKPQITRTEVAAHVTKESDEQALRSFERLFNKLGVELKFEDLKFSEGLLTNVAVSFRKKSTGTTGSLSLKNENGISPLLIYTDGEQVTMTPDASAPVNTEGALSGMGNSPLYLIEGKEYSTSRLTGKYLLIKEGWSALSPAEAKVKYGSKAKDGAIILAQSVIIEDFKAALKAMDLKQMSSSQNFIHVKENAPPVLVGVKSEITQRSTSSTPSKFELTDVKFHQEPEDIIAVQTENEKNQIFITQENGPLIIIDGEIQKKDFNSSDIDPSKIKTINVLKDHNAVEKYGEPGKNGVIEIELKTAGEMKNASAESRQSKKEKGNVHFSAHSIRFEDSKDGKSTRLSVRDVGSASLPLDVLYVVNGKEMPKDFDVKTISVDDIEFITVLKDAKAVEKYGEKASKGVIEIITKE